MATSWGSPISSTRRVTAIAIDVEWVRRIGNPGSPVQEFEEIAAATFAAGQFVSIDGATGQIQESAAGTADLLGVAMYDASGTAATLIPVVVGFPDVVFLIQCDAAPTQAQVGDDIDLVLTAGVHQADVGASATDVLHIVGLPIGFDVAGDPLENHAYVRVAILGL